MRVKAIHDVEYAGKNWAAGMPFDALDADAQELINRGYAIPFNLEDPSARDAGDVLRGLAPSIGGVTLTPESATAVAAGESGSVAVTLLTPDSIWTVTKDGDWVTITSPTAPQSTDGTVEYDVAANTDLTERIATLQINAATFTITQDAAPDPGKKKGHHGK